MQLLAISLHLLFQLVNCALASSETKLYRPSIAAQLDLLLTGFSVAVDSLMNSKLEVSLFNFRTEKETGFSFSYSCSNLRYFFLCVN